MQPKFKTLQIIKIICKRERYVHTTVFLSVTYNVIRFQQPNLMVRITLLKPDYVIIGNAQKGCGLNEALR
jgi:hypothetical protein